MGSFYRFYYRESEIGRLMILVLVGLLINITLNYGLGIYLSWGNLWGINFYINCISILQPNELSVLFRKNERMRKR